MDCPRFFQSGAAAGLPAGLPRFRAGLPGWQRGAAGGAAPNGVGAASGAAPMAARGCPAGSAGQPRWQRGAATAAGQSRGSPAGTRDCPAGTRDCPAGTRDCPVGCGAASGAASLARSAATRRCTLPLARAHASQGDRCLGGGGRKGRRLLDGRRARAARRRVETHHHQESQGAWPESNPLASGLPREEALNRAVAAPQPSGQPRVKFGAASLAARGCRRGCPDGCGAATARFRAAWGGSPEGREDSPEFDAGLPRWQRGAAPNSTRGCLEFGRGCRRGSPGSRRGCPDGSTELPAGQPRMAAGLPRSHTAPLCRRRVVFGTPTS